MENPYDKDVTNDSILGPTLKFKGELRAKEPLLVRGSVEGSIQHSSQLTIGDQGNVKATIDADQVVVDGTIEGEVRASTNILVKEGANVRGDMFSPSVTLQPGSTFNGQIDMSGDRVAKSAAPEGKKKTADAKVESKQQDSSEQTEQSTPDSGSKKSTASVA
jgi:cytoskeletal protein CcmA (bactofilin family)